MKVFFRVVVFLVSVGLVWFVKKLRSRLRLSVFIKVRKSFWGFFLVKIFVVEKVL